MNKDELEILVKEERYEEALNKLKNFIEPMTDEELNNFVDTMYDEDADFREITVSYDKDERTFVAYYGDEIVGTIDNHIHEMLFNSYESPLGKKYPLTVMAPTNGLQYADDDVSVAMFECFDRYVRSGQPFRTKYGWDSGFLSYTDKCLSLIENEKRYEAIMNGNYDWNTR